MGSLVLDIYAEYFVRSILNLWRDATGRAWRPVTATVVSSTAAENGMGCYVVEVQYRYKLLGERYTGTHKEPFVFRNYQDAYLRHFPGGSDYPIRVNPKDQSKSVAVRGEEGAWLLIGVPELLPPSPPRSTSAPSSGPLAAYASHKDADAQ